MDLTMRRSHKIRLNPTKEQEEFLTLSCDAARFAYNWGLNAWNEQYRAHKVGECDKLPHALELKKRFNAIKHEAFPWVLDPSNRTTEWGFERLGIAWRNYFDSVTGKRKGKPMARPRFKSRHDPKQGFRAGVGSEIKTSGHDLFIPKLKAPLNMAEPLRYADGTITSAIISHYAGQWWASLLVDLPEPEPRPAAALPAIGVDLGIKTLAVCSDGSEYPNPKRYRTMERKLARIQRSLSRKQKGSKNRERAKARVAKLHYHISCQRADAIHKMTTDIAGKADMVAIEDLNVKGMVKNRRLSKSISDASFGEISRQLKYKARTVVVVPRFFASSQLCSGCGYKFAGAKDLSVRSWACPECGEIHDRDRNAAKNIVAAALGQR